MSAGSLRRVVASLILTICVAFACGFSSHAFAEETAPTPAAKSDMRLGSALPLNDLWASTPAFLEGTTVTPDEVTPKPGDSINVSTFQTPTIVHLKEAGEYEFTGDSFITSIWLEAPGVVVKLKNSTIATSNFPGSYAPIFVSDTVEGTVQVKVAKGAYAFLEGFGKAPGIMKNGTKAQLKITAEDSKDQGLFWIIGGDDAPGLGSQSTDDASKPYTTGKIAIEGVKLRVSGGNGSAGLGGGCNGSLDGLTIKGSTVEAQNTPNDPAQNRGAGIGGGVNGSGKNITIKDSTIDATGGKGSAGIGGGFGSGGSNISIQGSTVKAVAGEGGAGIGGGASGTGSDISINGGTVQATGGLSAAGIGGGKNAAAGGKIELVSAEVHATAGAGAAGVGGGQGGSAKDIVIDGCNLTATASGTGSAIGVGGGCKDTSKTYDTCKITIKSGTIVARAGSHGAGIGCVTESLPSLDITIDGGRITAYTGEGFGVGGSGMPKGQDKNDKGHTYITINGGTIDVLSSYDEPTDPDRIGFGAEGRDDAFKFEVNGGCIRTQLQRTRIAKNKNGDVLTQRKILLINTNKEENFTAMKLAEDADLANYGFKDTWSIRDEIGEDVTVALWLWLPTSQNGKFPSWGKTTEHIYVKLPEGNPQRNSDRLLRTTRLTLMSGDTQVGTAHAAVGYRTLLDIDLSNLPDTKQVYGYTMPDPKGVVTRIADQNGTFVALVLPYIGAIKIPDYVWMSDSETETMSASVIDKQYYVVFNANKPKNASSEMLNVMDKQTITMGKQTELERCAFQLQGWKFSKWTENADGTGKSYTDCQLLNEDLTKTHGAYVNLYAQWEPVKYHVNFEPGKGNTDSSGSMTMQELTYDKSENLHSCKYTRPGYTFAGWTVKDHENLSFADKALVTNLCDYNEFTGKLVGYKLVAQWVGSSEAAVVITQDNEPVSISSPQTDIVFVNSAGKRFPGFQASPDDKGLYQLADLEPDTYTVVFEGELKRLGFDAGGTKVKVTETDEPFRFDFCTVSIERDEHVKRAYLAGNVKTASLGHVLLDPNTGTAEVAVNTDQFDEGYHFDGYSYAGVEPVFPSGTPVAAQTVTVKGPVELTAHAATNVYTVVFNPNASDVVGTMANQDMVYDEPQNLRENEFARVGHTFLGWNTKPDGSGTAFTNGQSVKNLASEHGVTVTLYAQWEAFKYSVVFSANKPSGASHQVKGTMKAMEVDYGKATALTANAYRLDGWAFTGWNTKPNGSGDYYADKAKVLNLASQHGEKATLYAQWTPRTYEVRFLAGESGVAGTMGPQTLTYDKPESLTANGFTYPGYAFAGWMREGAFGSHYSDRQEVLNLCTLDSQGAPRGITLRATWANVSETTIIITKDGQPVTTNTPETDIVLTRGTESFTGFSKVNGKPGFYVKKGLPPTGGAESYTVSFTGGLADFDSENKRMAVLSAQGGLARFDYATVSVKAGDEHVRTSLTTAKALVPTDQVVMLLWPTLNGSRVTLSSTTDMGYHFTEYTVQGNMPLWQRGNPRAAMQTVTVTGAAQITAHSEPNTYKLRFYGSAGGAAQGSMPDQEVRYDQAQQLFPNQFTRLGYDFAGWNTKADGTGTGYIDGQRVLNLTTVNGGMVELYAQWKPHTYTLQFDPSGAGAGSASNPVTGTMTSLDMTYDKAATLPVCAFKLKGWKFAGWNTEPDGSGFAFADGASVKNLASGQGATAVLYAQWERLPYTVKFEKGDSGATGTMAEQTMYFDRVAQLQPNGFTYKDHTFMGWECVGKLNSHYYDQQFVSNVCAVGNDGIPQGYTLRAIWADNTKITLSITLNGEPVKATNPQQDIVLVQDKAEFVGFSQDANTGLFSIGKLQSGIYQLELRGSLSHLDAGGALLHVEDGIASAARLDFAEVTVGAENEHVSTYIVREKERASDSSATVRLGPGLGAGRLTINSDVAAGYHFDGYSALGSLPLWQGGNPMLARQVITVTGKADITGHAEANTYTVRFHANASGATGSMPDQDMVYDQPQKLFANAYKNGSSDFTGWSTAPNGGGRTYGDGQNVQNLTTEHEAVVDLYAQWRTITPVYTYSVKFESNKPEAATHDVTGEMAGQTLTYGSSGELAANAFVLKGWTFAGWNDKADGTGTAYEDKQTVSDLPTVGDVATLFAQWTPNKYVVHFEPNAKDAQGTMADVPATYEQAIALPANAFTRVGHTFTGWNDKADGTGGALADKAQVNNMIDEPDGIATLYAQWKPITYTIRFDKNALDATGAMKDLAMTYGQAQQLPANTFVRPGYKFAGWNVKPDGSGAAYKEGESVNNLSAQPGTVTLHAQWTADSPTPQPDPPSPEPGPDDPDPQPSPSPDDKPKPSPSPDTDAHKRTPSKKSSSNDKTPAKQENADNTIVPLAFTSDSPAALAVGAATLVSLIAASIALNRQRRRKED